jgi:hypothetical protein
MIRHLFAITALMGLIQTSRGDAFAQEKKKTRDQMVRDDRERVTADGFWIYNDLPKAFEQAKSSGKPIVVVLRCIPCEECVKLDDNLVDQDPEIRPLLEQFVCVRVVSTNGLDLSLFQFDTDQSFAVFFLNADRTIYGRFGTRSHRTEWIGDVSLKGLAEALRGALELHADYPRNRELLTGKTGPVPEFQRPELIPSLNDKFTSQLDYAGDVAKSCIHCHQIGDGLRDEFRSRSQPLPETLLSPYPHPKSIGLTLDPKTRGTVIEVAADSPAAVSGLEAGDEILSLNAQPILSIADIQWVLHGLPDSGGNTSMVIRRSGQSINAALKLPADWKSRDDISWRASAWGLRRMVTGGLLLEPVEGSRRGSNGIPVEGMALRVKHVGQWDKHAAAKNAGFQQDDVLVSFAGRSDLMTDSDVLRYGLQNSKPGDTVDVELIRAGRKMTLKLPMQD